jgi:heme/copper-type cytochrome/quinol oxidase subunit 2
LFNIPSLIKTNDFSFNVKNTSNTLSSFDSYTILENDLEIGNFRLLSVDRSCIFLPVGRFVRLYVTSGVVLHTFAIPSFGLKIDACPGRLSQDSLLIKRKGLFYGQCSEIRGINHAFMPIVVKTVNELNFLTLYVNLYK